jgi:uncharacterized protein (DUF1684 family)
VFGDLSNKHETYGAGRFLEVEGPDAEGYTYIDFNKSYNPPCAFTPFATCPLPTKENKLRSRNFSWRKESRGALIFEEDRV